jgi:hypothetical protein
VNYLPGIVAAFDPLSFPGGILPTSRFNLGLDFPWIQRFDGKYSPPSLITMPQLSSFDACSLQEEQCGDDIDLAMVNGKP